MVLPTTPMVAVALSTDLPRASLAMGMDTMDMATTLHTTPMDITLDMDMARGPLMLNQDIMATLSVTLTEAHKDFTATMVDTDMVDTDMVDMDMVDFTARGPLMPSQDIMATLSVILTEAHKDFTVTMVDMDMVDMDMVDFMARGLLSQDIMAVPALSSTRAVLITMDLMAMVSTTMARGLLMLDILAMAMDMAMDMQAASSK